jgi:Putative MetA-pathway of phenol degradation
VLKVPLFERASAHVEYFGIFSTGKDGNFNHQYFSPGISYLVTTDLEIGARVGWGLNDQSARFFSNVGIGWRF